MMYVSLLEDSAWGYAAEMLRWCLYALFAVQGACWLIAQLKERGAARGTRHGAVALLALLLPVALFFMGIIDQIFPGREVRRKEAARRKKEGEDE